MYLRCELNRLLCLTADALNRRKESLVQKVISLIFLLQNNSKRLKTRMVNSDTQRATSTMTLEHVRPQETGYFGCKAFFPNKSNGHQEIPFVQHYVYIYSSSIFVDIETKTHNTAWIHY